MKIRHDWTLDEVRSIHDLGLAELIYRAHGVHREFHDPDVVQLCSLLSVKTGGCPEDCGYCPQSARHDTAVEPAKLMDVETVLERARAARDAGATRFCMGAAWREVRDGEEFDRVLDMVRKVRELGMESCVTLGMLNDEQARLLSDAGLTAYNHNIDTSREFYGEIIGTRTYDERLRTLASVRRAGIKVCCGGIVGLGESVEDRCKMLLELANLPEHPESVPINSLVAFSGTPLADAPPVHPLAFVRVIATARIIMPCAVVRLSAGRSELSDEAQFLCFFAGANSIFYGERLLTTGNSEAEDDLKLLELTGLRPLGRGDGDHDTRAA